MKKVMCYSRFRFVQKMRMLNWTDATLPKTVAVISICCTEPVAKNFVSSGYCGVEDVHYFADAENVLNIDFDDIFTATKDCGYYVATCITNEQALEIVKFIEAHKDCDFYLHCNAGKSRSQAVVRYIIDAYSDEYEIELNPNFPCEYPNEFVLDALRRAGKLIGKQL